MGTSVNQRSPARPTWKLPQALIGRADISARDQGAEIWRAASLDPDTDIKRRLSDPVIASACVLAAQTKTPAEAARLYDAVLNESRTAGLLFDLTRRALVRSVAEGGGSDRFAGELFSETVAYYASRDLPSYVGKRGRISKASEIIELKRQLQLHTKEVVSSSKLPRVTKATWSEFVANAVGKLSKKGTRR